jgi:hypothetical protein
MQKMQTFDSPILSTVMPQFLFEKLKKIISEKNEPHNNHLAGNIVREESFRQHIPIFEEFFSNTIQMYSPFTQIYIPQLLRRRLQRTEDKVRLVMKDLWVNHMKQYEFNPIHQHEGCFSFIVFVKIPFKIEEMHKIAPGVKGNLNSAGAVSFFHQGSDKTDEFFTEEIIFPDERWEGKILVFPASLHHSVNPFYGTEESRITVSGNIYVDLVQE